MRISVIISTLVITLLAAACGTPQTASENTEPIPLTQIRVDLGEGAASEATEDATADPITMTVTATIRPTRTAVPIQDVTQNQQRDEAVVAAVDVQPIINCTPRTDWLVYIVQAGDTLSSIARRTGSAVQRLVDANCLQDANTISVGQSLRVPVLPAVTTVPVQFTPSPTYTFTPTPTITGLGAGTYGGIIMNGVIREDGTRFYVQAGMNVTLSWWGVPRHPDIQRVEFSFVPLDGTLPSQEIGFDNNLEDGALVPWQIPANFDGHVMARAAIVGSEPDYIYSPSYLLRAYDPEPNARSGVLAIHPAIEAGSPADWSRYVLEIGTQVRIDWTGYGPTMIDDVASVQFTFTPDSGSQQVIGVDSNMRDGASLTWTVPEQNGQVHADILRYKDIPPALSSPPLNIVTQPGG